MSSTNIIRGVPAGLQGTVFSLSNVVIQSSLNSFGSSVIAVSDVKKWTNGTLNNTIRTSITKAIPIPVVKASFHTLRHLMGLFC